MRVICVLDPLLPLFLREFIELCPGNSITDRCCILRSVYGEIGDGVNLITMGHAPKINRGPLTRRLVVLFRKLEE